MVTVSSYQSQILLSAWFKMATFVLNVCKGITSIKSNACLSVFSANHITRLLEHVYPVLRDMFIRINSALDLLWVSTLGTQAYAEPPMAPITSAIRVQPQTKTLLVPTPSTSSRAIPGYRRSKAHIQWFFRLESALFACFQNRPCTSPVGSVRWDASGGA